jgi:hypothetical protein
VDLFVPGTGTPAQQVHDFNGGILASGLFWTVPVPDHALRVSHDGRRAVLEADDVPVIDSFQFFGPNQIPASVSFRVEWRATGPFERRGSGTDVPPTDMAAFRGRIAAARSDAWFAGEEFGFAFRSDAASSDRGWAQLGRTRNGVFLN